MHFTNNYIYGVGAAKGGLERDRNILEFYKYLPKLPHNAKSSNYKSMLEMYLCV